MRQVRVWILADGCQGKVDIRAHPFSFRYGRRRQPGGRTAACRKEVIRNQQLYLLGRRKEGPAEADLSHVSRGI